MLVGRTYFELGLPGIPKGARFHTDEDSNVSSGGPTSVTAVSDDLPTQRSKFTILLIEDDCGYRTDLAEYLREKGYKVIDTDKLDEARGILASDAIDLVLSDNGITNPAADDGINLRRDMLSNPTQRDIPFILMSCWIDQKKDWRFKFSLCLIKTFWTQRISCYCR